MSLATPDSILEQSADGASGDVRICEICDVAFSGKWSRKYCSQECRSEKNRKRVMEWRKKIPKGAWWQDPSTPVSAARWRRTAMRNRSVFANIAAPRQQTCMAISTARLNACWKRTGNGPGCGGKTTPAGPRKTPPGIPKTTVNRAKKASRDGSRTTKEGSRKTTRRGSRKILKR